MNEQMPAVLMWISRVALKVESTRWVEPTLDKDKRRRKLDGRKAKEIACMKNRGKKAERERKVGGRYLGTLSTGESTAI